MADSQMPFVGIIGGFWDLKQSDPIAFNDAKQTAQELGAALAGAGMGLVVYLSDDKSLEPYVVSGYVKALPPGTGAGSIRPRYADSQKKLVYFPEQAMRPEVFAPPDLFPGNDWEAPFYRSLAEADGVDAVLLMAGGRSTLIAGQIAVARKLPTLAVDKYDGSAKVIRTELAIKDETYPSEATHHIDQMVAWLKKKCDAQAEQRAQERLRESRYLKQITQKQKVAWAVCAFLALLVTFFFGLSQPPKPTYYALLTLIALIAAGAMGALIRSILWGTEDTPPSTSLVLGGIAGFVAGLAYLIPQYVGNYGILNPATQAVGPNDKIQFLSAVLVGIPAGVGFDTVFTRLKKQADEVSIAPPTR